ncbi:MAG: oligosaccharide flippase family protein, partial [Planctomycetota bacterium]
MSTESAPTTPDNPATGGGRPHEAIGKKMVQGLAWTVFFTVGNRVLSFVSQFLLGWLLLEDDYRIYAFVAPLAGVSVSLVNGGLDRLLIQRSRKFHVLAFQSFKVATGCNIGLGVGMAVLAMLLAWKHDSATVGWLALLLAMSVSFSSFPTLYMTKLQAELRFGPYSTLLLASTTCSHLMSIVLAAVGAGPYAFIVPLVVMNFANVFLFRYAAGPLPSKGRLTWRRAKVMLWQCRWILATAFAAILIYQGDYLVIGWFDEPWVGTYFFGYKLSTAFTAIVSFAIAKVTLAGFAKIAKEPERFKAAVVRAAGLIALTTTPVAIALALIVPAAVHFAWQGKWDASIFVAALMTAIIPVDLLNIFCRT